MPKGSLMLNLVSDVPDKVPRLVVRGVVAHLVAEPVERFSHMLNLDPPGTESRISLCHHLPTLFVPQRTQT
jgi:hypothetical protein